MNQKTKSSGWFEDKDPLRTNKKGEPVSPVHQEVTRKKEFEKQGFTGAIAIVPHAETVTYKDIVTLNFNVPEKDFPEFLKLSKEFAKETGIYVRVESEEDRAIIKIAAEDVNDLIDFLADKGVELDDEETKQVEEILGKVKKGNDKAAKGDSDKADDVDAGSSKKENN